jgi:hypothetical protein
MWAYGFCIFPTFILTFIIDFQIFCLADYQCHRKKCLMQEEICRVIAAKSLQFLMAVQCMVGEEPVN